MIPCFVSYQCPFKFFLFSPRRNDYVKVLLWNIFTLEFTDIKHWFVHSSNTFYLKGKVYKTMWNIFFAQFLIRHRSNAPVKMRTDVWTNSLLVQCVFQLLSWKFNKNRITFFKIKMWVSVDLDPERQCNLPTLTKRPEATYT